MKKIRFIFIILLFFAIFPSLTSAQPPYAKWGKIAVLETQKHYPHANVVDYLHIGRIKQSNHVSIEKFKLWLKTEKKEFGVYVDVIFEENTEKLIKVTLRESDR